MKLRSPYTSRRFRVLCEAIGHKIRVHFRGSGPKSSPFQHFQGRNAHCQGRRRRNNFHTRQIRKSLGGFSKISRHANRNKITVSSEPVHGSRCAARAALSPPPRHRHSGTGLGHCLCKNRTPVDFLELLPYLTWSEIVRSAEILEVVLLYPQRAKAPWFGTGRVGKLVRFLRRVALKAP